MAIRNLPFMLELIQRCRNCRAEVKRPPLSYAENPYCSNCLMAGIKKGRAAGVICRRMGGLIEITQGGGTLQ